MQTTYSADPPRGLPGMPADSGFKDDISTIVDEAGGIAPGLCVVRRAATHDRAARLPFEAVTALGHVLGISVRTHRARSDGAVANAEVYEDTARMPVRRKGRIYVVVENAFTPDDPVFVRFEASGANTVLGRIRAVDSDTDTCFALPGATLLTSGAAGDIAELELNL